MYSHKTTIPRDVAGVISRKHKRHFSYSNVTSKTASAPLIFNHCGIVIYTENSQHSKIKHFSLRKKNVALSVSNIQMPNARIPAPSRRFKKKKQRMSHVLRNSLLVRSCQDRDLFIKTRKTETRKYYCTQTQRFQDIAVCASDT